MRFETLALLGFAALGLFLAWHVLSWAAAMADSAGGALS
jgi:hypothetical protein